MIATRHQKPQSQSGTRTRKRGDLLELLAEYFCLRTKDIAELLRYRIPNESDLRSTRARLKRLVEDGYVHREPYFELDLEARTYVYGLTDKGVTAVDNEDAKSFDEHSLRTLDHELEISYFHIALRRFTNENYIRLYWQQSDLKRGIHPDALLALTTEKGTYWFFLEVEKSKLGNVKNGEPSIIRKLRRYADYYDTDQCERDWGFRRFRVVVIQEHSERKPDARRQHLLNALKEQLAHRMFWLTTVKLYKESIGGEIFATPKDYAERRYSFLSL